MANISILAFPAPGHTHGIQNLARALILRGHQIIIYTPLDGVTLFNAEEFKVQSFAESKLPLGSLKVMAGSTIKSSGIFAFIRGVRYLKILNESLTELKINQACDLLLYDELYLRTNLCYQRKRVSYSQALSFKPNSAGEFPEMISESGFFTKAFIIFINQLIHPKETLQAALKSDLHLLPYTQEFIGENLNSSSTVATGPWLVGVDQRLELKKDYIYASFGTLVDSKRKIKLIGIIKNVCEKNKIPALITWGSWHSESQIPFESSELVKILPRVDQVKILSEARLMITHGGLNTVQECILSETPMIVVPIKHDQNKVAKRVKDLNLGQEIDFVDFTEDRLEKILLLELTLDRKFSFQEQKAAILSAGGLKRAVEAIENAI